MTGLAAAQSLQRVGFQVQVVEQAEAVGGRVKSASFHGRNIECGAQFPSSGYLHMPPLLARAGMASRVEKTSPWAAFERNGRLHKIHQRQPITFTTGGLLSGFECARLIVGSLPSALTARSRDISNYASFAALDTEDALSWCNRRLGHGATNHLLAPTIHGFYFHGLEQTSRALIAAVMAFRGAEALAVRGGWSSLPLAMAADLTVRLGVKVDALLESPNGVLVVAGGEQIEVDWVVLAVPAPIAKSLLAEPSAMERDVLDTRYAAAMHVALGMRADWQVPDNLRGVHGLLLSPSDPHSGGDLVASMVVESARLFVQGSPEVLTVMLGDMGARRHAKESDDCVLQQVLQWLEARWPGIASAVVAHRIQRWASAEPLSPVGRASAIARYRNGLSPARRVILCGDYLGMPWTDGAVETGLWAADHIRQLSQRSRFTLPTSR